MMKDVQSFLLHILQHMFEVAIKTVLCPTQTFFINTRELKQTVILGVMLIQIQILNGHKILS